MQITELICIPERGGNKNVSWDRPPSVIPCNQTECVNIQLSSSKPCTSQDARFIKSAFSKLNAYFIALKRLCRFCSSALLHSSQAFPGDLLLWADLPQNPEIINIISWQSNVRIPKLTTQLTKKQTGQHF